MPIATSDTILIWVAFWVEKTGGSCSLTPWIVCFFFYLQKLVSFSTKVFFRYRTSLKYLGHMTPSSHSDYCSVLSRTSLFFTAWYFSLNCDTSGAFSFCCGKQLVRDFLGSQGFFWTWKLLGKLTTFLKGLRGAYLCLYCFVVLWLAIKYYKGVILKQWNWLKGKKCIW